MPALRAEVNGRLHRQRTVCTPVRVPQECVGQRGAALHHVWGLSLEEAVSRELRTVLEPAAIEAAVLASEQENGQQDEIISALKRELEAAQYNARRAEKQYDATDPQDEH